MGRGSLIRRFNAEHAEIAENFLVFLCGLGGLGVERRFLHRLFSRAPPMAIQEIDNLDRREIRDALAVSPSLTTPQPGR
jgi:hypothetical protein